MSSWQKVIWQRAVRPSVVQYNVFQQFNTESVLVLSPTVLSKEIECHEKF